MRTTVSCSALALFICVALPAAAQQTVPIRNGIPVAPTGLVVPPLPDKPVAYHTAEGQDIRVVRRHAWADAPVEPRVPARRRHARDRAQRPAAHHAQTACSIRSRSRACPRCRRRACRVCMDIALHPQFAENHFVYSELQQAPATTAATLAARARPLGRHGAHRRERHLRRREGTGGASRLAFGRDGMLYITTGGGNATARRIRTATAARCCACATTARCRRTTRSSARPGYKPEIYTLGHRSSLGLACIPATGEIWQNENGPNGGDEINMLKPGANYGWPLVSFGRTYPGPWQSRGFSHEGFEPPIVYWTPAIAVSGMTFYTGDSSPKWKGDVFVGAHALRRDPGHRPPRAHPVQREHGRAAPRVAARRPAAAHPRRARRAPTGCSTLLTDEDDGAMLRIEPAG